MSLIEVSIVTLIIICVTRMYCDGAWGVDPEIQTLAALLNTSICDVAGENRPTGASLIIEQ